MSIRISKRYDISFGFDSDLISNKITKETKIPYIDLNTKEELFLSFYDMDDETYFSLFPEERVFPLDSLTDSKLLKAFCMELPVPPIVLKQNRDGHYWVITGIETLKAYLHIMSHDGYREYRYRTRNNIAFIIIEPTYTAEELDYILDYIQTYFG